MKNIESILKEFDIEKTEEQLKEDFKNIKNYYMCYKFLEDGDKEDGCFENELIADSNNLYQAFLTIYNQNLELKKQIEDYEYKKLLELEEKIKWRQKEESTEEQKNKFKFKF